MPTVRAQKRQRTGEPRGDEAAAEAVAAVADTDAMSAGIRTALLCLVLACVGCTVAATPGTAIHAATGGGGNDGGGGGGMGG